MAALKYEVSMSSEQHGHEMFGEHTEAAEALAQAGRLVVAAAKEATSDGIARDVHISVLPAAECDDSEA